MTPVPLMMSLLDADYANHHQLPLTTAGEPLNSAMSPVQPLLDVSRCHAHFLHPQQLGQLGEPCSAARQTTLG